jgi:RimJ/RimL family protein N-acetyltransferase
MNDLRGVKFPYRTTDGDVTLRQHTLADIPHLVEQCRDPEMVHWTTVPSPYEHYHAEEFVASRAPRWADGIEFSFAVDLRGRFAGTIDLRPKDLGAAEVGFGLHPWARGQRVTPTALRLILPWAFDDLDLDVILWRAMTGNWGSRKIAWALGFHISPPIAELLAWRTPPVDPDGYQPRTGRRQDGWYGTLLAKDDLHPRHPWIVPPVLTGEGLVLRLHRERDIPRIAQACTDVESQRWLPQLPGPFYTEDDARTHLDQIQLHHACGTAYHWAITDQMSDELLGDIALFDREPLGKGAIEAEVGYWVHPFGRGHGLAGRAARIVSDFALESRDRGGLGLRRLRLRAAEGNIASATSAERAGFSLCGREGRNYRLRDGRLVDTLCFERLSRT